MERLEWIDKFYLEGVLIKPTIKQLELLSDNAPMLLYQYRSIKGVDCDNVRNLIEGVIWESVVDSFNDPFDCDFNYNDLYNYQDGLYASDNEEEILYVHNSLMNEMVEIKACTAISCFSEKKDSILMWSHYANNHTGICVCYDIFELMRLNRILVPVWYRNEKVKPFIVNSDGEVKLNDRIKEIFVQKSLEWSYEEEWRLIDLVGLELLENLTEMSGRTTGIIFPKKVIIGAKMDNDSKCDLIKVCKEKNIPVTQMKLCDDEYKLEETEYL